jgi:serine protease
MNRWIFVFVLALLAALASAAPGDGAAFYKMYWKQRDPLRLDPSRVAVYQSVPVGLTDIGGPMAARLDWDGAVAHAIDGWTLVPLTAPMRDAADARATVAALAAGTTAFVSPVFLDAFGQPMFVTDEVFLGVRTKLDPALWELVVGRWMVGEVLERGFASMPGVYRMDPVSNDGLVVLDQTNRMALDPDVAFAEPGMVLNGRPGWIPNDPEYPNLWGLRNTGQFSGGLPGFDMGADLAWDMTWGDAGIRTLVLDNGVDRTHPDIHQIAGRNFTTEGNGQEGGPVGGWDNHGTAVAGCISAIANNGIGVAGIAPGTVIVSAKPQIMTSGNSFTFQFSWVANALAWGTSIGCRVSNNSNSYGATSATIDNAYQTARNNGMVHFASAGNDNTGTIAYPSSLPTVNSVMSVHYSGARSGFSNWGPGVDFAAPGSSIRTTDRQGAAGYAAGDYTWIDGTSFSSPYAAGVAALVLSRFPGWTPAQVENRMAATARDMGAGGYDTTFGWGLVRADHALSGVTQPTFVVRGRLMDGASPAVGTQVAAWTYGGNYSASASPNAPINDFAVTHSTINFQRAGTVGSLEVSVDIRHTYIGDLQVFLTGPDGTMVLLHNRTGGAADDIITTYPSPTAPAQSLAAFNGRFSSGTWRLSVADQAAGDTGTLRSWGLNIAVNGIARGVTTDSNGWYAHEGLPEGIEYYFYPYNTGTRTFTPAWRRHNLGPSRWDVHFWFQPQAYDIGLVTGPYHGWVWDTSGSTIRWYKFTIPRGTTGPRYLDMDTEGTNGYGTDDDTEIALYAPDGTLLAYDDDSGSGRRSLMSFGPQAAPRPSMGGAAYAGQNGTLPPGDYYVAQGGFNTTFQPGFHVTSNNSRTGSIQLNWRTNVGARFVFGNIDVGAFVPGPNGQQMNFTIRQAGPGAVVGSASTVLAADGSYFLQLPWGLNAPSYALRVRGADLRWLGQIKPSVPIGTYEATGVNYSLILGDVDGDNTVGLQDFLLLASTYEVSPPTEPAADLDGDGQVNLTDFLILAAAYDMVGD